MWMRRERERENVREQQTVHTWGVFPLNEQGSWCPSAAAIAVAVQGRWVGSPSLAEERGGGDLTYQTQRENSSMKAWSNSFSCWWTLTLTHRWVTPERSCQICLLLKWTHTFGATKTRSDQQTNKPWGIRRLLLSSYLRQRWRCERRNREALIRNGREENHAVMMLKEEERRCKTTAPVRLYSFKILNLDYTFRSHLSPQLCYFLVIPHSRFMRSVHGYFRYAVLRGLKPHAHKHSALCVAIFRWQINSKHATAAMPLWHTSSPSDVTAEATVRGKGWPPQCTIEEPGMQPHKDRVRLAQPV